MDLLTKELFKFNLNLNEKILFLHFIFRNKKAYCFNLFKN